MTPGQGEPPKSKPVSLDYWNPATPRHQRNRPPHGRDTFAGSCALLFAILLWAAAGVEWVTGASTGGTACMSLGLGAGTVAAGIAALCERGPSRTFPLVALALLAIRLVVVLFIR